MKLYDSMDQVPWDQWIYDSVLIKKTVTEIDPEEKGLRKILNFGHTLGHAIESYSLDHDDDPLTHGEAIAIGMICESYLSVKSSSLSESELDDITRTLITVFGKERRTLPTLDDIKIMLLRDKKNKGGTVMYTLLESIGSAIYNQVVDDHLVQESLNYYSNL